MEEKEILSEEVMEEVNTMEQNEDAIEITEDSKDIEILALKDTLQRLQADFNNYRRRSEKEKSEVGTYANEKIMLELLSVIDNMERAILACDVQEKESGIFQGVELVMKQLVGTLNRFGLEEIVAQSCEFDPNIHYAVAQEESEEMESNMVVEVFQKGYKLSNKVIRPSMVKVSK